MNIIGIPEFQKFIKLLRTGSVGLNSSGSVGGNAAGSIGLNATVNHSPGVSLEGGDNDVSDERRYHVPHLPRARLNSTSQGERNAPDFRPDGDLECDRT